MKSKGLSVELRDTIVKRHRSGEGYKTISGVLTVPKSTVSSIIRKWKEYATTQTLPRAGRPTKLSTWARRTLVRVVIKNLMTTLTELQSFLAEMEESYGRTTIFAALHKSRLYGRVARQKPLLRKRYMTARLEFAKRHVKDSESMSQKSLWSDEMKIELFGIAENGHSSSPN